MSAATVAEHKQAFLRKQKLILSRRIDPSKKLLALAEKAGVQQKVLRDVMLKVDRDLKRHGREVYSRQMMDHIVEQIDLLYWEAGAPALDTDMDPVDPMDDDSHSIYQSDDLTVDKNISKLPSTWDASLEQTPTSSNDAVHQDEYISAAGRLHDLSAQRLILQQKLTTYKTLLSLLEPYRNPQESIQPNLVNRDAPLASELSKTRTLAIRVAGRVGEKYDESSIAQDEKFVMVEEDGKAKLDNILTAW